ncbi:MAG: peptidase [Magnetococcales bacterium]|nr:peptidase [Magnetococcales bacterium]
MNAPENTLSIQIFRPGRHTAMNGKTLDFSLADLERIAKAYDPGQHEAPVVIGHPETDDPAYGWVNGVSVQDGCLEASLSQMNPDFVEAVREGRYKKISASFYPPGANGNPKPDSWYLRHVGFLGAQPPAVKGLRSVQFSDDADGVMIVEFNEINPSEGIPMSEPNGGVQPPIQASMQPQLDAALLAREAALKSQEAQFAEQSKALQTKEEQLAQREKALKAKEGEDRERRSTAFAEQHTMEGRILPRETRPVAAILDYLEAGGASVSFSEGDGAAAKTISKGAAALFRELIQGLPKRVEFAEIAGGSEVTPATDPNTIAERALAFCEAQRKIGKVVSIADAVTLLSKGGGQ